MSFVSLSLALLLLGVHAFAQASRDKGKGNYSRILLIAAGISQHILHLPLQAWCAGREEQGCCPLAQRVGWGVAGVQLHKDAPNSYILGKGLNLGSGYGYWRGRSSSASMQLWLGLQRWGRAYSHQSVVELGENRASQASVGWGWCQLRLGVEKTEQIIHNFDHSSRILHSRF